MTAEGFLIAQAEVADLPIRVLLIEDDLIDEIATLRTIKLDALPYDVRVARTMAQARKVLLAETFDVILADYQLDHGTSFDLIDAFGDHLVIFITGAWDPTAAALALRLGVHDYLIKDLDGQYLKLLHYRIETALRLRRLACQLRESEARLQAILDNAPASISAHDLAGHLILSNRHHALHSAVPEVDCSALPPQLAPQESEETRTESDGSQHTYLTVRFALPPAHGQGQAVGSIAVDITERRRASEALLEAKAAAEAANAAKSAFLSNISHEIRTPLNAVIGVTHLLAESGMTDDQMLLLRKAQIAGRSLLGIVNDVLDLAKIEAGEVALDETPYQPVALLGEIEAVYAQQARDKGLSFAVVVDRQVPAWLQCDSSRLRQVLVNLITNALKFTHRGGVVVELSLSAQSLGGCELLVRVRDTGIGIDPVVQHKLFSPFIQADVSTTRRYGGTGLGLSIVKRLAQIMGGAVGVQSVPGEGSEFWLVVPQTFPADGQMAAVAQGHSRLEVLLVDDVEADRMALTAQVQALGWDALALDSGAALLHELRQRQASGQAPPDFMLVNWQLAEMDGLQTLAALPGRAAAQDLPAALLVRACDRDRIGPHEHVGLADQILIKPLESIALFNAVNASLARRLGSTERVLQSTRVDATDTFWLAGVRVLLVDDSDINLEVARRLLESRGACVQTCTSGAQALDCLQAGPADFDAVLMDVQMPDMDGLEATRRIRSECGLERLPVIALTAGALVTERRQALDAGMQEFLSKPLDPAQLIRVLRRCVEAARDAVLPVTASACKPEVAASAWPALVGIDAVDVAGRLGKDLPLFLFLLRRFLTEFGDLCQLPDSACDGTEQRLALAARIHKLRGGAGTIGARELHRLAGLAETSLRAADTHPIAALRAVSTGLAALAAQTAAVLAARSVAVQGLDAEPAADGSDDRLALLRAAGTAESVRPLLQQLKSQDLAALDSFQGLEHVLRGAFGRPALAAISAALDELDFTQALELMTARLSPETTVPFPVPATAADSLFAAAITD